MNLRIQATLAAFVLAASCVVGQTTGVPLANDFTVTCVGCGTTPSLCWPPGATPGLGGISGSTSCNPLFFDLSGGGTFTLAVTCVPGGQVTIFTDPCPCTPCFAPLGPTCLPIPFTACGASTNQSVDLDFTCPLSVLVSGFTNTAGVFTVTFTIPPLPPFTCLRLSSQAVVFPGPACAGPFVLTQAYDINIGS